MDVETEFVIDSGSGEDLIGLASANRYRANMVQVPSVSFSTANGSSQSQWRLPVWLPELEDVAQPSVLRDFPGVLPIGKRCRRGFSFIWLSRKAPCVVAPFGRLVPCDVARGTPVLQRGGGSSHA